MRIWEMSAREDFRDVFTKTLERDWSLQFGIPIRLSFDSKTPDVVQHWRHHPGVDCFTVLGVDRQARRFIRNSFRHTPVRHRRPAQWLVGTGLGTSLGLRLWAKPGFSVTPEIDGAEHLVILPGNQRIRVFDFRTGMTRAILKEGFRSDGMRREIEVRADGAEGPFPPISAYGNDFSWFEEPIIDGLSLSRCPPSIHKPAIMEQVHKNLQQWAMTTRQHHGRQQWAENVRSQIIVDLEAVNARYGEKFERVVPWLGRITEAASFDGMLEVSQTHGDLQEGNVLITSPGDDPLIIDWEHSGLRSSHYDSFTLGLGSRWGPGFAERLNKFVNHGGMNPPLAHESFKDPKIRRLEAALFILEDFSFYLHESLSGPYRSLPQGLLSFLGRVGVHEGLQPTGFLSEFL